VAGDTGINREEKTSGWLSDKRLQSIFLYVRPQ